MAFGFDRLVDALTDLNVFPADLDSATQILVTVQGPDTLAYNARITARLQSANIAAVLYSDPARKLEAQIKYALTRQIPYVIIAGPEEERAQTVQLKHLSSRIQKTLKVEEVAKEITS
jgi:histidyl-tRNA synthetase